MGKLKPGLLNKRAGEAGQATLEYLLLLSLTAGIGIYFSRTMISTIDQGILKFGGQLERDLKTGRASINVFGN